MPAYKDSKRGTWFVKFRYTDWQGNRKETTKRGFSTKREAKEYEEEYRHKLEGTSDMTFQSLYEIYLADRQQNVKESTYLSIKFAAHTHLLPCFGTMKLSDITPNAIRKWQNDIGRKGLKPSTVKQINRRLSAVLAFAVKFCGMQRNPMTVTGAQGSYERRVEMWSKEEFDRFIAEVESPIERPLFLLLYYTGMRIGEALALTRQDIDFEKSTINIDKTFNQNTGQVTTPKTKASIRTVTIPDMVADAIKALIDNLAYDCKKVFPMPYSTIIYHYRKAIQRAGVRNLPIHCLRHAHVSYLISHGVPVTAIAKRVGHTSPQVTLSIYAHADKNSEQDIKKLLENS
jgi:integrase